MGERDVGSESAERIPFSGAPGFQAPEDAEAAEVICSDGDSFSIVESEQKQVWAEVAVMKPPPCPRPPPPVGERPRKWTSWAQKPPLRRGPSPSVWDDRLDAPGQRRGQLPSSVWT